MAGNGRQKRKAQCDGCGESVTGDHTVCSPCLSIFSSEHDAALQGQPGDALAAHYRLVNLYTVCCARAKTRASYRRLAAEIAETLAGQAPALARKLPPVPRPKLR